ncbi:MAG: helix-turn-helix domain containing protein [Desulfovibrionaceae bacterium]|nr:helix-turn-helix domain containing protein [Desulfovibrionaceae bacterium]
MQIKYCELEGYYILGQEEYEGITADAVLARFKVATGTKAQVELARWLGVRQALISDVQRRNIFPIKWLSLLLEK